MLSDKQRELDAIEKQILVTLFGTETLPDATGYFFNLVGINPNSIIADFEKMMLTVMNEDGSIDGALLKKILSVYPRFGKLLSFIEIPEEKFFLSDKIFQLINILFPGVKYVQN
jgi:hypothetical protein